MHSSFVWLLRMLPHCYLSALLSSNFSGPTQLLPDTTNLWITRLEYQTFAYFWNVWEFLSSFFCSPLVPIPSLDILPSMVKNTGLVRQAHKYLSDHPPAVHRWHAYEVLASVLPNSLVGWLSTSPPSVASLPTTYALSLYFLFTYPPTQLRHIY